MRHPDLSPLLVILTDERGTLYGTVPPQVEAYLIADHLCGMKVRSVVVNMESSRFDQGLAQSLADLLGGVCYRLTRCMPMLSCRRFTRSYGVFEYGSSWGCGTE